MTSAASRQAYILPQLAVFACSALAVPAGLILYRETGHLSYSSLLANMVWATLNLSLAAMVLAFSLRRRSFKRTNYRFRIPLVARLKIAGGSEIFASIDDLSSAGLFLMAPRELMLNVQDRIAGVLFLPDGPVSFDAVIKARHRTPDSATLDGLGCEFTWEDETARHRLERFLYGSDLEWHLHHLSEINWTVLGGASDKDSNVVPLPVWANAKTANLTSMIVNPADASVNPGIIAMDARNQRGVMMVFKPLSGKDDKVEAMLLTAGGWRTMRTRVANQNNPDRASNMYLYELEGLPV